ncbi:hypothetical protein EYF80_040993 [Liparis tanakae]|uniref:Uncharacterized protein n=1 Tax=Liparis tanakae TaxID=230148 RepID=A0A4Z2G5H9_9TELE|nr:hypothetical protein EYF80_040993 [Liparis tanakae]
MGCKVHCHHVRHRGSVSLTAAVFQRGDSRPADALTPPRGGGEAPRRDLESEIIALTLNCAHA